MGLFSRKPRQPVAGRLLAPFHERWSAEPTRDEFISESLAWQHVEGHLDPNEVRVVSVPATMEFPDLGEKPARGDVYVTDRAVLCNMSLSAKWESYVTRKVYFNDIGYAGPSRFNDGTFSIGYNTDDGVGGWFLRFGKSQSDVDFLTTFLRLLKQHGGYQGPPSGSTDTGVGGPA